MRALMIAFLALTLLGSCTRRSYTPAEQEAMDYLQSTLENPEGFQVNEVSSAEMRDTSTPEHPGVQYTSVGIHYSTRGADGQKEKHFQTVIVCECGNKGSLMEFMHHRREVHNNQNLEEKHTENEVSEV